MKKIITILSILTLLVGCNKLDKKSLTVIDDINIGVPKDSLTVQFYMKNILQKELYTKSFFEDYNDIENYKQYFQMSQVFDFPNFKNQNINHYGVYLPVIKTGTNNVIGLNILLGHTDNATLLDQNLGIINISNETNIQSFDQNTRIDLLDKIESLLYEKYGEPTEKTKRDFIPFFVLEGKTANRYGTQNESKGDAVIWKTKNMEIIFFKGIPNYNTFYDTQNNAYFYLFEDNSLTKKINKNQILCNQYAYISYNIDEETIKKLELDKIKL